MEDAQILALFEQRNELAISETAQVYGGYCHRIAENILCVQEDAEECVSDTYLTVWNHIPPDRPAHFRVYLGTIVRNLSLSRYRANHAKKRYSGMEILLSELSDCIPAAVSTENAAERKELSAYISQWLRELKPDERGLFLRRYWYGERIYALAEAVGCSENAMAQRMLKLRKRLSKYLESKGVSL